MSLKFFGLVVFLEMALVLLVLLIWSLTDWHASTNLSAVLAFAGILCFILGIFIAPARGAQAEMQMQRWNKDLHDEKEKAYFDQARISFVCFGIGLLTLGIALLLSRISM